MSEENELYDLSIEMLDLSDDALRALGRYGVQSIGHCIEILQRWGEASGTPHDLIPVMTTEVQPQLEELGYWPWGE